MKINIALTTTHKKLLAQLRLRFSDLTPAMQGVARIMKTRAMLSFSQGVSPYGAKWPGLKLRSGQALRDTGQLMNSITTLIDSRSATVGSNLKVSWKGRTHSLAAIHQFGAVVVPRSDNKSGLLIFKAGGRTYAAKKTVIPARPFLPLEGFPPQYQSDITDEIIHYLAK